MEFRILIAHNGTVYDATPVTLEGVELVQSIRMEAGCLRFSVVRDGILNFVEGDKVQFYVDGLLRFAGWVMTKERTSAQIIAVTAYDMLFYLAKNKDTNGSGKNDCRRGWTACGNHDGYGMEDSPAD